MVLFQRSSGDTQGNHKTIN